MYLINGEKLNFSKFINDFLFTLKYDSISKKEIWNLMTKN